MASLGIVGYSPAGKPLSDTISQYFSSLVRGRSCGILVFQAIESAEFSPPHPDQHPHWDEIRSIAPRWHAHFATPTSNGLVSSQGIGLGILSRKALSEPFHVLLPGGQSILGVHGMLEEQAVLILTTQLGVEPKPEQLHVLLTLVQGQKIPVILAVDEAENSSSLPMLSKLLLPFGLCPVVGTNLFISRELHAKQRQSKDLVGVPLLVEIEPVQRN